MNTSFSPAGPIQMPKTPWRVVRSENPDVYGGHDHLAIQESANPDGSGFILADLEEWVDEKTALLIAAAPQLLEALKEAAIALDFAKTRDPDQAGVYHCPPLRAILKAIGQ